MIKGSYLELSRGFNGNRAARNTTTLDEARKIFFMY